MTASEKIVVGTISSANYWPYTATLIESLARVCPHWEVRILALTDLPGARVPARVRVIPAGEVWGDEVAACHSQFNLFEWACASKPRLLRHLLGDDGASVAVYVDSDIEFFAAPESIASFSGAILLQPNVATVDECQSAAWDRLHLQYGAFNGGFLAVRAGDTGRAFLDWWDHRVVRYSCAEPSMDVFSDQRWLDLVPGLFPQVEIDRSLASNVAIWNVAGRKLAQAQDGRYLVGDEPLVFFHYHRLRLGMDVETYLLDAKGHSVVGTLVRNYLQKAALHSSAEQSGAPRHDIQGDGSAVPLVIYKAMRDAMAEGAIAQSGKEADCEKLRDSSFDHGRLRARVRTLSYHWAHARHIVTPDADVDRYQHSPLYRAWVDIWFFLHGRRQAHLPENWVVRSRVQLIARRWLARLGRILSRQCRSA